MNKKISIITISYNSENTIEKTILSVLGQDYRPLEYVLVDGGSNDNTLNIINNYLQKFEDNNIEVVFKSEPDKGISDAFNKGISLSSGDIVGIINSDDQLFDHALINVSNAFDENIGVVCGDCLWIDTKNDLQYIRKSKMNLNKLKYEMVLMHPTCFVKKDVYDKYGLFDVDLHYVMDKDLMARFYKNGVKFKYIPKTLAIMSSGGVSDINVDNVYKEGLIVAERNGVPKWKMLVKINYSKIKFKIIKLLKQNKWFEKLKVK